MKQFVLSLIEYSVFSSPVVLLYMAVTPLLSKRYSAKGLYYAWLVMVTGLFVPFRPRINVPVMKTYPAKAILPANEIISAAGLPIHVFSNDNGTVTVKSQSGNNYLTAVTAVWISGMIIFLLYHCIKHYRFRKTVRRWCEKLKDDKILALMSGIMKDLDISGKIDLYSCTCPGSPMLVGLFSPAIILPAQKYTEEELYFILKHELVHYKRKDLWHKILVLLAVALHWFNPVVHLMARVVNVQCELSCDAEVVAGSDAGTRQMYCEILLGIIKDRSFIKTSLSTNFYGGKKGMKNRISLILDTGRKKIGVLIICLVLTAITGTGIASKAASPQNVNSQEDRLDSGVEIKLLDYDGTPDSYGTSVSYADSRPGLEFRIEGENIARIDISCENEYLYAVDWTKTQDEKYWNAEYYQTYDEKTQISTFHADRLYDRSMSFEFDEDFNEYDKIWYRWTAYNLYLWASENNYSHFLGYGTGPKTEYSDSMSGEEKLALAAGYDGSGKTGLGHIQLDGYPEELTRDRITVIITNRNGNTETKHIIVEVRNNEFNETIVTANLEE